MNHFFGTPHRGRYGRVLAMSAVLSLLALPAGTGQTTGSPGALVPVAPVAAGNPQPVVVPLAAARLPVGESEQARPHAPVRAALSAGAGEDVGSIGSVFSAPKDNLGGPARPLAGPDYGVFDSIAVPIGGLKVQENWRALVPGDAVIGSLPDCAAAAPAMADGTCRPGLLEMAGQAGVGPDAPITRETLERVNRGVNRFITYGADELVYGHVDHWASIDEILALRRGDCEDYAIAKMWLLAALGMPLERMQLVVLHDTRRRLYHAVLVVHHGSERLVLDNTTDRMLPPDAIHNYVPLYSLAADRAFVHGFPVGDPARISQLVPIGEIHPGLGVEPEPQGAPGDDLSDAGTGVSF